MNPTSEGILHPLTQIGRVALSALGDMGFEYVDPLEVDTAWYVFDSLRMGPDHPARDDFDTFWTTDGRCLRPHASNMQLHVTDDRRPPLRAMYPGTCYRNDATDATHEIVFTQLEALAIDEDLTVGHLKGVLETFIKRLFGPNVKFRFRPSFFPFTEPSFELDIYHNGQWIEVLGSGMVHPEVLTNMRIDPSRYSGLAFGMGLDRLAIIKWGIEDIRLFRNNKLAFLRQFRGTI